MKRTIAFLTAVLLAAVIAAPALAVTNVTMYVVTGNQGPLNMRTYESLNADIIAFIPYGTAVTVTASHGTWSAVIYAGRSGYVMSRYLSYSRPGHDDPGGTASADYSSFYKVGEYMAMVSASRPGGYVNLRWAPTQSAAVIERIYDGQYLTVICVGSGWYQVEDPNTGYVGFMMSSFLN